MWACESSTYDKLSHGKPRVELIFGKAWSVCAIKLACWEFKKQKQIHTQSHAHSNVQLLFRALCSQITDFLHKMNSNTHLQRLPQTYIIAQTHCSLTITASEEVSDRSYLICFDSRYSLFLLPFQKHIALPRTLCALLFYANRSKCWSRETFHVMSYSLTTLCCSAGWKRGWEAVRQEERQGGKRDETARVEREGSQHSIASERNGFDMSIFGKNLILLFQHVNNISI